MLLHLGHDPQEPRPSRPDDAAQARAKRYAMTASLVVAVVMLVGKMTAYVLTGSTAILSDALESVIHLAATGVAGFSLWYAAQPPDKQHPYGHGKVAYFSSGFEGALILLAAFGILYEGGRALIEGPELQRLGVGLLITGALALVNLGLGVSLIRVGRRTNTLVLVANGHHVLTDMWTSLGVLVGIGLVWATGLVWLDPVVAILAGLNIMWTAQRLIRDAFRGLMEKVDAAETERVLAELEQAQGEGLAGGFHHVRHRRVNDRVWIETHLLFPDDLALDEAHRRASAVEARLRALFPQDQVEITSHLEPLSHEHSAEAAHDEAANTLAP